MEDRKDDEGTVGWEGGLGWSRRVNLSRPLATLSRRAILRITSAASGQEMKIAPTLFNLDKSICYTTNGVAGWYILEEATLRLSSEGIFSRTHIGHGNILFSRTFVPSEYILLIGDPLMLASFSCCAFSAFTRAIFQQIFSLRNRILPTIYYWIKSNSKDFAKFRWKQTDSKTAFV